MSNYSSHSTVIRDATRHLLHLAEILLAKAKSPDFKSSLQTDAGRSKLRHLIQEAKTFDYLINLMEETKKVEGRNLEAANNARKLLLISLNEIGSLFENKEDEDA